MRTHTEIIRAAGAETVRALVGVSIHTVRSWAQRRNIPSEYWKALSDAGHATLEELAQAAANKEAA